METGVASLLGYLAMPNNPSVEPWFGKFGLPESLVDLAKPEMARWLGFAHAKPDHPYYKLQTGGQLSGSLCKLAYAACHFVQGNLFHYVSQLVCYAGHSVHD